MSDVDAFVIDDDFDPLADLGLDDGERDDAEADYLPPIPDADKRVVPPVVPLPVAERIEKLLAGIPGQQFRLLHAVAFCEEPKTMDEVAADLDAAYPATTSVYGSAQVVQLLERDGALERIVDGDAADAAVVDEAASAEDEDGFISVTPAAPCRYRATRAGLDAIAAHVNEGLVVEKVKEDERYLPIFQRVLEMTAREGGCPTKELDRAVDGDPLCQEPRRFCGFFRGKLEETGAIEWRAAWTITELGRSVLASGVFAATSSSER